MSQYDQYSFEWYQNKHVLVTGGLGFIGSNLSHRLVALGAHITVVDALVWGCGGSVENLLGLDRRVIFADIGEINRLQDHILRSDVIFNLAGSPSHQLSMVDSELDLTLNALSQMKFALACSHSGKRRIVYASTRQIYGIPHYLPVDELHPISPTDMNGMHKHCAEMYHLMLGEHSLIDPIVLRLSNVYGPRMAVDVPFPSMLATFIGKALSREAMCVFGTGGQMRDPLYVDDAVDAFLISGMVAQPRSRIYNLGGPATLELNAIAKIISDSAGLSTIQRSDFPAALKEIDIGSYSSDITLIENELGWRPTTHFADGVGRTLEFFRAHPRAHPTARMQSVISYSPTVENVNACDRFASLGHNGVYRDGWKNSLYAAGR